MAVRTEKFILFYLGGEKYALPALSANQFIEFSNLALVPKADQDIKGLIYHNGNVVTIIDLKRVLKIMSPKREGSHMCLTFEYGGYYYGLLVDQGDETLAVKNISSDRQRPVFKRYFTTPDKKKVYILDITDILSQINIYD